MSVICIKLEFVLAMENTGLFPEMAWRNKLGQAHTDTHNKHMLIYYFRQII